MVRIPTNPLAVRADTLQDLRDEFLVRCHAKNLSPRTIEWYAKHSELFIEWCRVRGVTAPAQLTTTLLEEYLIEAREAGRTPNTVRGYAQTLKTLSRFGHKKGLIPENIKGADVGTRLQEVCRFFAYRPVTAQEHSGHDPSTGIWKMRARSAVTMSVPTINLRDHAC